MLLNRNSNCNSGKTCSWFVFTVIIAILGIVLFGARHKIKSELREFIAIDKEQIEKIVQDYINQNPKMIITSIQEMQKRDYEDMMKQAQAKIHDNKDALQGKNSQVSPFTGNKDGDVVIVTFLDYRCGYCKRSNNDLKELVKKDSNVKVVFKELPVLGPQSQKLAKMALAVYLIDNSKYMDFHNALMESNEVDDQSIDAILKKLSLDSKKVTEMMQDTRVAKELESVASLAGQLNVRGTPAFIIDEELIPGAIDLNNLLSKIQSLRTKKTAANNGK